MVAMGRHIRKLELLWFALIFSPVMVVAKQETQPWVGTLIVLSALVFFVIICAVGFFIHHYGLGCLRAFTFNHHHQPRMATARGLDETVIAALPSLVFSKIKMHQLGQGELECAICLYDFKDQETLSLLPNCSHVFHTQCIKPWLASHVTCPVCRANLERGQESTVSKSKIVDQISGAHRHNDHIMIDIEGSSSHVNQITNGKRIISKLPSANRRLTRCHSTGHLQVCADGGTIMPNLGVVWPNENCPKSDYRANSSKANLNRWDCFATAPASPNHTSW